MPPFDTYKRPEIIRIGRAPTTERLYKAEARRDDAIKRAITEWLEVMGRPAEDFWTVGYPQQLLDILSGWDNRAAYLAATAYLIQHPNPFSGEEFDRDPT
jgi:hypothetical protein